eukprot:CAMPEP_0203748014 /NCGR_PEP_ID=MMETSP0098-20131031/3003_1 /ASSEMBLY_ACC=CAM_ASM_000208 /TAXON_ID=96639 /ORGANISM=" , Strain NY0313808BC1" /LENGTH=147 /DNA_ID=CAMNT_0050636623 /DNA_START=611 /DNA_END=1051 /DNA_ORIENTATION=+
MLRRAVMNTAARAKAGQALGRANTRSFGSHGAPKYKTMFGEKPLGPGEKRKRESWELIYHGTMVGGLIFLAVGLYYKPNTSIRQWAKQEALARELIVEAGGEVELGRNYAQEAIPGRFFEKGEIGEVELGRNYAQEAIPGRFFEKGE